MIMQEYKVLITASGTGSRLGELTKYFNKSLIRVGKKPAISYIIESYTKDTKFVITLGYLGDIVKQFIEIAYPDINVEYVTVDNYDGMGSSLLYSIKQCKDLLQCSFVYHACDTITNPINPDGNCIYISKSDSFIDQYRTYDIKNNKILEKKFHNESFPYIGLCSIKDYKQFWNIVDETICEDVEQSDCTVLNKMIDSGIKFNHKFVNFWYDIGNLESLNIARINISDKFQILDKLDESIYIFEDKVVKYFHDKNLCKKRVDRTNILKDVVPKILKSSDNFYSYEFVDGDELSHVVDTKCFEDLLNYTYKKLWSDFKNTDIKKNCLNFYKVKTEKRLNEYFKRFSVSDSSYKINGISIPSTKDLLIKIDFDWLCSNKSTSYHGDFILENIIKHGDSFTLIDWRQDFDGDIENGDAYYDLAKMNHNLIVDHSIIYKNLFSCSNTNDVDLDILVSYKNIQLKKVLNEFIKNKGYDLKKVELLTGLIWLNMSPLHEEQFAHFVYNLGKYKIYEVLYGLT